MEPHDWQQQKYEQVFQDVCDHIAYQRQTNPDFSLEDLKELLENQYLHQDLNWTGKGIVAEITDAATIAAYESALAAWSKESAPPDQKS